jgi:hypothetical protein
MKINFALRSGARQLPGAVPLRLDWASRCLCGSLHAPTRVDQQHEGCGKAEGQIRPPGEEYAENYSLYAKKMIIQ